MTGRFSSSQEKCRGFCDNQGPHNPIAPSLAYTARCAAASTHARVPDLGLIAYNCINMRSYDLRCAEAAFVQLEHARCSYKSKLDTMSHVLYKDWKTKKLGDHMAKSADPRSVHRQRLSRDGFICY